MRAFHQLAHIALCILVAASPARCSTPLFIRINSVGASDQGRHFQEHTTLESVQPRKIRCSTPLKNPARRSACDDGHATDKRKRRGWSWQCRAAKWLNPTTSKVERLLVVLLRPVGNHKFSMCMNFACRCCASNVTLTNTRHWHSGNPQCQ